MKYIIIICILSLLLSSCSIQPIIPQDNSDIVTTAEIDNSDEYAESSSESVKDTAFETVYDPTSAIDKSALTIPFVKLDITPNDSWSSPVETEFNVDDKSFWDDNAEQRLPQEFILYYGNDAFKVEWDAANVYDDSYNDYAWYAVTEVCHLSKYWRLPEPVPLIKITFRDVSVGDILMLGYSAYNEHSWHGRTVWYYINDDGIWQMIHTPYEDGVQYTFYKDNEQIKYGKVNCVYIIAMTMNELMNAYTDDNQFYYENGLLEFKNGKSVYKIESSNTINDLYLSVNVGLLKELRDKYGCKSVGEAYAIYRNDPDFYG